MSSITPPETPPPPEECSICIEPMTVRVVTAPCGHRYHTKCLDDWLGTALTCPMCRAPVPRSLTGSPPPNDPIAPPRMGVLAELIHSVQVGTQDDPPVTNHFVDLYRDLLTTDPTRARRLSDLLQSGQIGTQASLPVANRFLDLSQDMAITGQTYLLTGYSTESTMAELQELRRSAEEQLVNFERRTRPRSRRSRRTRTPYTRRDPTPEQTSPAQLVELSD